MAQYYAIYNLDKHQWLDPTRFNDGLRLREFGTAACGSMLALAALLAHGNGLGSGDIASRHEIIGSWTGDRIVVLGDYADFTPFPALVDIQTFVDISEQVLAALWEDPRLRTRLLDQRGIAPPQPVSVPLPRRWRRAPPLL